MKKALPHKKEPAGNTQPRMILALSKCIQMKHYPLLKDFVQAPFAESMLMPMNGEVRNALSEILLKYIAHHSESALNVQSLKVLRELYG